MKTISAIKFVLGKCWRAAKGLLLLYFTLEVVISLNLVINTFIFKGILDGVGGKRTILGLSIFALVIVRFLYELFNNILSRFGEYIWNLFDIKQAIFMNQEFIRKLKTLDLTTYETPAKNDKIWRSFNRIQMQFKWYLNYIVQLIAGSVELIISVVIFFLVSPGIAIFIVIANIVDIWVRSYFGQYTFTIYRSDSETRRRFEYLDYMLCSQQTLPELKLYNAFDMIREKLVELYHQFTRKQLVLFKKIWLIQTLTQSLPVVAIFVFTFSITQRFASGKIQAGSYVFLFTNIFIFSGALKRLGQFLGSVVADTSFIWDAIDFFNLTSVVDFPVASKKEKEAMALRLREPLIKFDHVSFAYPSAPDKPVLKDISFSLPYGQNLAIIGENGAGKTTLIKLLMRMYDPNQGDIYINNINLKTIPETVLYLLFSTLFQTYGRFELTIRDNLEMAASRKLEDEESIKALKFSNAWNYVKNFPKTLDQQLGTGYKDGVDLSGGQWQQLAIAKAYLKKAPVFILDEPTSAIDARAEMEIFDRLNKETKENSLIFISHRFSTIKDAERIIVIDKGKIIEDGSHEKLMKNKGKYASLYTIQAARYQRG